MVKTQANGYIHQSLGRSKRETYRDAIGCTDTFSHARKIPKLMDRRLNNEIYDNDSDFSLDDPTYCADNSTQKIFYYDSRRAGGGKTWDIIETTSRLAKLGRKYLIVQPTTRLIDETFDGFSKRHPTVTTHKFHSNDGVEGGTMARVMSYFNNADLEGAVVLITHSTFLALPYFYRKDRWKLYIDEEIRPFEYFSKVLIRNHTAITDHVELMDNASSYSRLRVTGHSDLKVIADNKGNDVMRPRFITGVGRSFWVSGEHRQR